MSKNETILLVCDGTSIPAGYGVELRNSYSVLVANQLGNAAQKIVLCNVAIPGQTTVSALAHIQDTLHLYDPSYQRCILILDSGTNDLYFGATAVQTESLLQIYWGQAIAAGFEVIAVTLMPRSGYQTPADFYTTYQEINTWIRQQLSVKIADVATSSNIGQPGNEKNTNYFLDLVHPTILGHETMASYIKNVIVL